MKTTQMLYQLKSDKWTIFVHLKIIHTIEYSHDRILEKRNKAIPWINLKNNKLKRKHSHKKVNIIWFHLYEISQTDKSTGTKGRLLISWDREEWVIMTKGYGISLGSDEKCFKMDSGNGCTTLWI